MTRRQSNKQFALQDKKFRKACEQAGIDPTSRQASKYRNKQGLAYQSGGKKNG